MRLLVFLVPFFFVFGTFAQTSSSPNGYSVRSSVGRNVDESQYQFPFVDPWIASISSGAVLYRESDFEKILIELLPHRRAVPLLENRNKVSIGFLRQKTKFAPLAFVISGTGGSAFADKALWLGKQLYNLGYHVVTLPNTINFQYTLGVSGTGAPGYVPKDAKEYYSMMSAVTGFLKLTKGIQVKNYSVVGYSLGGLLAGFVADIDKQKKEFNFEKIVMLNPAVDLGYAIGVLDSYFEVGNQISSGRKNTIMGRIFSAGVDILDHGFQVSKILDVVNQLNLSENEKRWVVGQNFRTDLRDVVFVSQQINDNNVLATPVTKARQSARLLEAFDISFSNYMLKIVVPNLKADSNLSLDELLYRSSLHSLGDSLKSNKNLYIFTNADDFIHKEEDIKFMRSLVGDERFFFYPHGGHCGNFWFEKNQLDFQSVMAQP